MFKINKSNSLKQIINLIFILICFFCFICNIIFYYKFKKIDQKMISSSQSLMDSNEKNTLEEYVKILKEKVESLEFARNSSEDPYKSELQKRIDDLKSKIIELEDILENNKKDKKTDSIIKLAQNIFQKKIDETQNSKDKLDYKQLLNLMEKFKKALIFRDESKKSIESQQTVLNGLSSQRNSETLEAKIKEEKVTLKAARDYLNNYANIISLFVGPQEEINQKLISEKISPSIENLLKQIDKILTTDVIRTQLALIRSKKSDTTNKILSQLN